MNTSTPQPQSAELPEGSKARADTELKEAIATAIKAAETAKAHRANQLPSGLMSSYRLETLRLRLEEAALLASTL